MKPPEVDRIAGSKAAVAARRARAEVKRQVASGRRTARDVLDLLHDGVRKRPPRGHDPCAHRVHRALAQRAVGQVDPAHAGLRGERHGDRVGR